MNNDEKTALTAMLHKLILRAVPHAQTLSKYGGVLYTLKPDEKEGQFCGVFVLKAHVQRSFSNGATLDDPDGVLSGSGKYRRHLSFKTPDDVQPQVVTRLLKQAALIKGISG